MLIHRGTQVQDLGILEKNRAPSLYELLTSGQFDKKAIKKTLIPNLDIITSTYDLAASEIELAEIENREKRLKNILIKISNYDYFFIDCPSSI